MVSAIQQVLGSQIDPRTYVVTPVAPVPAPPRFTPKSDPQKYDSSNSDSSASQQGQASIQSRFAGSAFLAQLFAQSDGTQADETQSTWQGSRQQAASAYASDTVDPEESADEDQNAGGSQSQSQAQDQSDATAVQSQSFVSQFFASSGVGQALSGLARQVASAYSRTASMLQEGQGSFSNIQSPGLFAQLDSGHVLDLTI